MGAILNKLDPAFRAKVVQTLAACKTDGVTMVPYDGLRTPSKQAILWRQSRSSGEVTQAIADLRANGAAFLASILEAVGPQSGPFVTNAHPGNSWHQWAESLDCFWEVDGKAEWSTTKLVNGKNGYQVYAAAAKATGLDAGHLWTGFKDSPHVQLRSTASPLKAGLSWSAIDAEMEERFGGASFEPAAFVGGIAAAPDPIRLSFAAPEGWRVFETTDVPAALFRAGMSICADGAPRAYHKSDAKALDYLSPTLVGPETGGASSPTRTASRSCRARTIRRRAITSRRPRSTIRVRRETSRPAM